MLSRSVYLYMDHMQPGKGPNLCILLLLCRPKRLSAVTHCYICPKYHSVRAYDKHSTIFISERPPQGAIIGSSLTGIVVSGESPFGRLRD